MMNFPEVAGISEEISRGGWNTGGKFQSGRKMVSVFFLRHLSFYIYVAAHGVVCWVALFFFTAVRQL